MPYGVTSKFAEKILKNKFFNGNIDRYMIDKKFTPLLTSQVQLLEWLQSQ